MGSPACVKGFCPRRYPLASTFPPPLKLRPRPPCPGAKPTCPNHPQAAKPQAADTSGEPQEEEGPDDGEVELEELDSIDDPDGVLGDLMKRLQSVRPYQSRT